MRGELVALDLETTGLDPKQDAIIEIGAVRMLDGEITAEFSTLVDPGIPIPPHITHITGIRTQDVAGAPRIETVLPRIEEFVGTRPVIAHNTSIDMGFLQGKHRILLPNLPIDTYDLASVLLPRAPRYNLHSLTSGFEIQLENAHRALDDARATALLYWRLWHKLLLLPHATLREIVEAARHLPWESAHVFEAALQFVTPDQNVQAAVNVFAPLQNPPSSLKPVDDEQPINPAEIERLIGEAGELAQTMPGYEYRPQQLQMTHAIAESFGKHQHLMVEAGTGTGKSMAYLIPAMLWAIRNKQHVVVSTNTINLQDQLILQDIPALKAAARVDFDAAVLKGRGNYLCPRRLSTIRRRRPTSLPELRTLAKILVWLLESNTGDKGEISLRGHVEHVVWQRLSAEDENCTLNRCQAAMNGACPFYKARKAAEAAHVVIVNHALLISDSVSGNNVLPDYRYLVVDEAHQLEEAVTNGLSFHIDQTALIRRIADLGGPNRGLLGEILLNARGVVPDKDLNRLEIFIQMIDEATTLMRSQVEAYYGQIQTFLKDAHSARASEYTTFFRVTPPHRGRSSFAQVQAAWTSLSEYFEVIAEAMQRLSKAFVKLREYDMPGYEDFVSSTETAAQYLGQVYTELKAFSLEPDANKIYWLSVGSNPGELPTINSAPLHIGPLVESHLWMNKDSVILTSATLRTNESFAYIGERLYADQVPAMDVGSPFDYKESTLIYVPNDIPEPADKTGYQRAVERGIIELAAALNGRMMVLFTSYSQLRQTSQSITPRLALGNITVYDQSDGSSRQALVDGFKSTEKAVLLGTRSFWEGVDIPGESLSALVITRLPFTVPTDPIFAARSETYNDPFNEFAVPDAILRFRQGFGRLIRTKSDRGVVTVFDSRVVHKSYGMQFLEALPECTIQYGSLDGLAVAAAEWLK